MLSLRCLRLTEDAISSSSFENAAVPIGLNEHLLPLRAVPAWLAERGVTNRKGQPLDLSVIYEWVKAGKLEVVKYGRMYTSAQALERMGNSEGERADLSFPPRRQRRAGKQRANEAQQQRHEKAKERLRAMGLEC